MTNTTIRYANFCPNCGAPNSGSPLCSSCGSSLAIGATSNDIMIYDSHRIPSDLPRVSVKNCGSNRFLVIFCLIFGVAFAIPPISMISISLMNSDADLPIPLVLLFSLIFGGISIASFIILGRHFYLKSLCNSGEYMTGTVRGYENSNSYINGVPVLNIFIETFYEGRNVLLKLNLGSTEEKYAVDSEIGMKHVGKYFMILD